MADSFFSSGLNLRIPPRSPLDTPVGGKSGCTCNWQVSVAELGLWALLAKWAGAGQDAPPSSWAPLLSSRHAQATPHEGPDGVATSLVRNVGLCSRSLRRADGESSSKH